MRLKKLKFKNILYTVDTHTAGEPTRIVLSGLPKIKGKTVFEKRKYFQKNYDHLRKSLVLEPRGHDNQFGALVLNTEMDNADYATVYMDNMGYMDMCGHGTIGITTALIEMGLVEPVEPYTKVAYETVAGLVTVKAKVEDGAVESVSMVNVPSFYVGAFVIDIGDKKVPVDVAYGGNFYVIAEAKYFDTRVRKEYSEELIKKGIKLRDEAARQIKVQHPDKPEVPQTISHSMITDDPELPNSSGKDTVLFGKGQFDRSPCGTGTSARISALHSKGQLNLNEDFVHESIINTQFTARILQATKVGPYDAIIPEVTGRAFITQISQLILNPDDPFKNGFTLL